MFTYISCKNESGVEIVEIDHAPANTLSSDCISELRDLFAELRDNDDVKAIVLTGKGRFFVAGADIKEFIPAIGDEEAGRQLSAAGQAICDEIEAMNKPVIAAINGAALGGGLELALGCHLRIMSNTAFVGLPELKLGLIPSFGGTQRLSRITGAATAIDLILSSRQVYAEEALKLGIVQSVVPPEELLPDAIAIARSFIDGKSMTSIQFALECILTGSQEGLFGGLKKEQEKFAQLFLTDNAKEGIQAFKEKRKPIFSNKSEMIK